MSESKVKLLVTQEKFDEIFSIEDWLNFENLDSKQVYEKMLQFVVDDSGNYLSVEDARELFRKIPKKDWTEQLTAFVNAVSDAFVNPTNGGS